MQIKHPYRLHPIYKGTNLERVNVAKVVVKIKNSRRCVNDIGSGIGGSGSGSGSGCSGSGSGSGGRK